MNEIFTILTPAFILLVIAAGTRFFPPSLGNAFLLKGPQWWARDQKTWDTAYCYLSKVYATLGIILSGICGILKYIDWFYAPYLGFGLLFLFLTLAHIRTRRYMHKKQ